MEGAPAVPDDPLPPAPDLARSGARTWAVLRSAAAAVGSGTRLVVTAFLDLLFPSPCLVCDRYTGEPPGEGGGGIVCGGCLAGFRRITEPWCLACGEPFAGEKGVSHICGACERRPPPFHRARSLFAYEGPVLAAVHRFKYRRLTALAEPLGRLMADALPTLLETDPTTVLVPVPLHRRRLRQRTFNQALLLARAISHRLKLPVEYRALARTRWTRPQVGLSLPERRSNVQGAFTVPPHRRQRVEGRHVLLIDDLSTSGSTGSACAAALVAGGARQVDCFTLARPRR
ncbi:MAG: ComF family protein [Deltaproteobacteria bacterium]|nr:ComF family protein [Deltaproteobacteria bacterium]